MRIVTRGALGEAIFSARRSGYAVDVYHHLFLRNTQQRCDHANLDSLELPALHILKIDAEGMEFEVMVGARETIARCAPVIHVEHLKVDKVELARQLKLMGYAVFDMGQDYLCIPQKYEAAIRVTGVPQL